ncbi:DUF2306 domain-containing protein [Dyadobacter frigoris]|uniref:DUF2306 domain-containing protein n=1 Tax=Dyadobacter frigoris TaxID=2576211 RepID=A0A4V6BLJ4_9BACT|nr:DUF2306 domain-containing protein [Dyadobacter frigoris]TKT90543.1 DUF2306 domain-containing protein [Dyadobacter frigoris]GLU51317.1 hypothetical protein Dfri01_07780 [Dyadobacter frigoris]
MIRKSLWGVFAVLAILVGLYPVIYFLIDRKFGLLASKSNDLLVSFPWNVAFYTHIILAGIALFIGWVQFSSQLRGRNIFLHRAMGKIYVIAVLVSSVASVYIGFFATGGILNSTGFISLGIIWFSTTLLAYVSIRKGQIAKHQRLMIFSYAACFAGVTLRIELPLLQIFTDASTAYAIVAWLCWIPNLIVAYLIAKRSVRSQTAIL